MSLRPYQDTAASKALAKWESGEQRTALVLATGAGKTVIFSEVIRRWLNDHPGDQVLVLAHRTELLSQAAEKIRTWAPGLRVGYVQAGINQTWAQVVVASQQTLQRQSRLDAMPRFGLVVVDECHRSMSPSYQRVLAGLGCLSATGPRVLGVTATFTREDSARLTDFWQSVAFSLDILDLIDDGYLVPPKFKRVLVEGLDLTAVKSSRLQGAADLAAEDLDRAMEEAGAPGVVAAAYLRHAADRSAMAFTPTVSSAHHLCEALTALGVSSRVLHGGTPKEERRTTMREFNAGRVRVLVNCALLTEGVDAPITSCVLMARPTLSKILFRQIIGRGLRLAPGKEDCLVLDMVGATGRNDLSSLDDVTDRVAHVKEDETLTDAVKREARERVGLVGEAMISGSLDVVDVDPWEAERRSKLSRTEREKEDADPSELSGSLGNEEQDAPEPAEPKQRYQHIDRRDGWLLRSAVGAWFIPVVANRQQKGFVVAVSCAVALQLPGIDWRQHVVKLDSPADAARVALNLTLELVRDSRERALIDPDAKWRRRDATQAQLQLLAKLGEDECDYQGQAADLITIKSLTRSVDNFAGQVVRHMATV